jgi:hypothetical protein
MENLQRVVDEVCLFIDTTSPSVDASSDTTTVPIAPSVCVTTSARQGQRLERQWPLNPEAVDMGSTAGVMVCVWGGSRPATGVLRAGDMCASLATRGRRSLRPDPLEQSTTMNWYERQVYFSLVTSLISINDLLVLYEWMHYYYNIILAKPNIKILFEEAQR